MRQWRAVWTVGSVIALLAGALVAVDSVASAAPETVLFVAGSSGPPSGDRPISDRLTAAGLDVTIVDDDDLVSGGESGFDLIVVASSVVPSKVGPIFAGSAVPLITWEPYLFADLDLSSGGEGEQSAQSKVAIVDFTHPIAAGVQTVGGDATVATSASSFSYGTPGGGADIVGTIVGQPARASLFTYEVGSQLASGASAPARRVALFPSYATPNALNATGRQLIDNAIEWALAGPVGEPVDQPPVVDAGADRSIELPSTSVTLAGSASDDGAFTSTWVQLSGPSATIINGASPTAQVTVTTVGTYTFALTADDGVNPPVSDSVVVTVSPESTGPDTVLFVAGSAGPPSGDRPILERLTASGLEVTVVDDDAVTPASAAGFDLVVISSSVVPSKVGSMFTATSVPVLTWEGHLFDDLDLSGALGGEQSGQTSLDIVDTAHPVASGVAVGAGGAVTVATSASSFSNGTPGGDVQVVATLSGQPSRAVVYTYEAGAALTSGAVAPARRVALFPSYSTGARLNAAGWDLVDNAVDWALASPGAGPVDQAPTVDAGPDQSIALPTTVVTLTGSAADDGPTSSSWSQSSGPASSIDTPGSLTTDVTISSAGIYTFVLSVDDGVNAPVTDSVSITVGDVPVDQPPTVDAGADQALELPASSTTLSGTVVDDGSFVSQWSQISGPTASIADAGSVSTQVQVPTAGTYVFELSADDAVNSPVVDSVTVTVNPEPTGPDTVLFVAGSVGPPSGDRPIRDLLLASGLAVTVVDDDAVSPGDEAGFDLVVVTSSVVPSKVESLFVTSTVPVVTWEPYLFADLGLSASTEAEQSGQSKVEISDSSHPIAGGLAGTVTVAVSSSGFSYGAAGGDAQLVATLAGQSTKSAIVAYESGAELASGDTAPARRVGLFMSYSTPTRLNSTGLELVDNAITWALEAPQLTLQIDQAPTDLSLPEGSTATFEVVASSDLPLTYQWIRDGVPLDGANSPVLALTDVRLADDGAQLAVEVSNAVSAMTPPPVTLNVFANTAPTASISPSQTSGAAALAVVFDGSGSSDDGAALTHRWAFGDGTTAEGSSVQHTFYTVGQHTVDLVVTDEGGLSDTESVVITTTGPVATGDEILTEPGAPVGGNVFANDTDPAGGGLAITDVREALASNRWGVLPIRSEEEFTQGLSGGEAEQHPRSMVRAPSNPDVIYFAQDVGQVWRSRDNGHTWEHTRGEGLNVFGSLSLAVDPVDADRLFLITSDMWNSLLSNHEAIYTSADGGDTWTAQRNVDVDTHIADPRPSREHQENIAHDPTSVGVDGATTWYAAIDSDAIYRTVNTGDTWTPGALLSGYGDVHNLLVHPTDGNRLYLSTSAGLLTSGDGGLTVTPLGDLPAGEVSWVALRTGAPSTIYAVVRGDGLFVSTDSGSTFAEVLSRNARAVFLHPTDPNIMYLTGDNVNVVVSTDNGSTWSEAVVTPPTGLNREVGNWKRRIMGIHTAISPDPRNTTSAVAYSRAQLWRTEDGGANFANSSELFTGYNWGRYSSSAVVDSGDPDRFAFFVYDVGMVSTTNGGDFFEQSNVNDGELAAVGVNGRNMHSGDYQPGSDGQVMVASAGDGAQSALVRSIDGARTWSIVHSVPAMNFSVRFHPNDPMVVYAGTSRSTDGGLSFVEIPFLTTNKAEMLGYCPANPDVVYASNVQANNNQFFRSDDRGVTWAPYGAPASSSFTLIDKAPTFAVHPTDCDVVYSISQGDLATFDGSTWTQLGLLPLARGAVATNFVQSVVVDPTDPNRIYATMLAPGQSQVWRSDDAGVTWQDVTSNLPRLGAFKPAVHPTTGDLLVGSAIGTWVLPSPSGTPSTLVSNTVDPSNVWIAGYDVRLPSGATVDMAADGSFTYDPGTAFDTLLAGESATDWFDYEFVDVNGARVSARVDVTVARPTVEGGPNQAPTVSVGPDRSLALPTNTVTLSGVVNDPDSSPTTNWIQLGGPTSTISSPTTPSTSVTLTGGPGSYVYALFVYDGVNPVVSDSLVVTLAPVGGSGRVTSGLLALYEFDEGTGDIVGDSSGVAGPDLTIENAGAVEWLSGGLAVKSPTRIASLGAASAVSAGVKATDEVSIEAWMEVDNLDQNGPARIVTISSSAANRNITLGQGVAGSTGDRLEARLRTTTTTTNGTPALRTATGSLTTGLSHVVFTRAADGTTTIYLDGAAVATGTAAGSMSAWNLGYELALANELVDGRPWRGDLYLVAIYDRAMTPAEVTQNLQAGPNDISDTTDPVISDVAVSESTSTVVVTWTTDEPATGEVAYGTTSAHELGTQTSASGVRATRTHRAVIGGLAAGMSYEFEIRSTDANGNQATPTIVSATTTAAGVSNMVFDLWYGQQLDVGLLGTPHRWANVLGSISDPDGVVAASYSLDGSAPIALSLGPDNRRLVGAGDFNVDLLVADLADVSTVTISATDGVGNVESTNVTIVKHAPPAWSMPYVADWSAIDSIPQAAVVSDGRWTLDAAAGTAGVEIANEGYNRILLIGDTTWTDYEVTVPVTVSHVSSSPGPLSGSPAFGLIANWNGNNDSVNPGNQPQQGYLPDPSTPTPMGAIMWWRNGQLRAVDHNATTRVNGAVVPLVIGSRYQLKLQVDRGGNSTTYRYKMWLDGTTEPSSWGVEFTSPGGSDEPLSGSLGLMAHEVAVEFGAVSVTPL